MSTAGHPKNLENYIVEHLDEALAKRWIQVYFQPVVRTISRQVCGMEALARWDDPEHGLLTPDAFIGVLEKHRRIHELDTFILQRVCESFSKKKDRVFVPVSVNLSRLDYELCDIFSVVEDAVQANKVPRSCLCIEITESMLANNEALMHQYIDRFRSAGYAVWMDDFGSGYSSLNVLKDFEFDELKIDMRFLSDFHPRSKRILASIVNMAKHIRIQTLAEGVETEEQFEFLRSIGCEKIQGFLFGRPMPYQECLKHLSETGLEFEAPRLRRYYDELGRLNVLSATPFQFITEKAEPVTGRELNSIPLAIIELSGDAAELLFANLAFENTMPAVDWQLLRNSVEKLEGLPLERLSRRLTRLLDEARKEGEGKLLTVYNDDYYEMRAKRLSQKGSRCALLMGITNLSQIAALDNQQKLDDGLRSLYSVYEQVSIIDLGDLTVTPLHRSSEGGHKAPPGSLHERIKSYAAERIFPEDQKRYLRFMNPDTLEQRIAQAGSGSLTIHLRTQTLHGAYAWKCYLLVRIREEEYYLLVRDAQGEVREFRSADHIQSADDSTISPTLLWNNVVNHSSLKFFWKDRNRRFLGASRSFLDYYDFVNTDAIIGKTDEDMGWHIHPDLYHREEQHVLEEGANSVQVEGSCLARGENRNIVASKMPLYSDDGKIIGLIGYFFQEGKAGEDGSDHTELSSRTDELTGLLNSHGLYEDLYTYIDEYQLRGKDFARIEVSIEDLAGINARYGFDFGDSVIRETGKALLHCCRNKATVGRMIGCQFIVLCQYDKPVELEELVKRIRSIPSQLREVNGMPFTMFLSVGMALYSESENKDIMASQAELRRLTDDVTGVSQRQLMENTRRIFQMYDDLPLCYAVYKVIPEADGVDAVVLYVNREYLRHVKMNADALIGKRVRSIFPMKNDSWLDLARQAGMEGKTLTRRLYYSALDLEMIISAHPLIGPGFCAFTYQILDELPDL